MHVKRLKIAVFFQHFCVDDGATFRFGGCPGRERRRNARLDAARRRPFRVRERVLLRETFYDQGNQADVDHS